MDELKTWLGDVFYKDVEVVKVYDGYESDRITTGTNYSYSTFQRPFHVTVTETSTTLDAQAVCAFILVVMVFLTAVTWIRGVFK